MNEPNLRRRALHEAGHAVADVVCRLGCEFVTINSSDEYNGVARSRTPLPDDDDLDEEDTRLHVRTLLAGQLAEEEAGFKIDEGGAGSDDKAISLLLDSFFKAAEILDAEKVEATKLLRDNWLAVENIAEELFANETLSGARVEES